MKTRKKQQQQNMFITKFWKKDKILIQNFFMSMIVSLLDYMTIKLLVLCVGEYNLKKPHTHHATIILNKKQKNWKWNEIKQNTNILTDQCKELTSNHHHASWSLSIFNYSANVCLYILCYPWFCVKENVFI